MKVVDILQFIFAEMQKAIEEKNRERMLELGSTVDVLYEISKHHGAKSISDILQRVNYVVYHFEDKNSFVEDNLKEIERLITDLSSKTASVKNQ